MIKHNFLHYFKQRWAVRKKVQKSQICGLNFFKIWRPSVYVAICGLAICGPNYFCGLKTSANPYKYKHKKAFILDLKVLSNENRGGRDWYQSIHFDKLSCWQSVLCGLTKIICVPTFASKTTSVLGGAGYKRLLQYSNVYYKVHSQTVITHVIKLMGHGNTIYLSGESINRDRCCLYDSSLLQCSLLRLLPDYLFRELKR